MDGAASASEARAQSAGASTAGRPYRIMLVDDSVVVRSLLARILEADPEIEIIASLVDGKQAVDNVARYAPDVVVLDIEMPVMDGLTALPKLIEAVPGLKVIMASTLTLRNAGISMKALEQGAADYLAKPEARAEITGGDFERDLLSKVKALGAAARASRGESGSATASAPKKIGAVPTTVPDPEKTLTFQPISRLTPQILAIGSSTGGPKALLSMLEKLAPKFNLPIVISQHMPATFTTILAEHIGRATDRPSQEGTNGGIAEPGHIYIAPGDYHMTVEMRDGNLVTLLDQGERENFCRPAVDRMMASVVDCFAAKTLAVILTGMGHDGLRGCEKVIASGGTVVTQNAATSVVWGMPGAVAEAGMSCANLPIDDIGAYVSKLALGDRK